MSDDNELFENIRHNGDLVLSEARKLTGDAGIGFNHAGVEWLDGFIRRQREGGDPKNVEALVSTLGSFLGECIIRTHGGQWARMDGMVGVKFDDKSAAFPFAKASKHLNNGDEDSVLSFFKMIPKIRKGEFKPLSDFP